jgi:hypothetical protein
MDGSFPPHFSGLRRTKAKASKANRILKKVSARITNCFKRFSRVQEKEKGPLRMERPLLFRML